MFLVILLCNNFFVLNVTSTTYCIYLTPDIFYFSDWEKRSHVQLRLIISLLSESSLMWTQVVSSFPDNSL